MFEDFLSKMCKIIVKDGEREFAISGELLKIENDFLFIRTDNGLRSVKNEKIMRVEEVIK